MAQYDIGKSTTTDIGGKLDDYEVDSYSLDFASTQDETGHTFSKASEYFGYYKNIPELKKAIDALATWTVGIGWNTDTITKVELEHVTGWGEDSFQSIIWNMIVTKKIIGDSFAEIIKEGDLLINIKPISPERMKIITGKNGMIKRYEYQQSDGGWKKFKPEKILHLCNDRVGDEIHGTSVIEACKWVIDARNEALSDKRLIEHRNRALGIAYYDTDDTGKINYANSQIEKAVKKGEMLGLPKETVQIAEFPNKTTTDKIAWIQYLEGFFYQAVGIPRVIATSQDYTEAASKVGFLTFEPVYTSEQQLLEQDLWNQLGIKITFNRPPSLGGTMQASEVKNTGQTGFQPTDLTATATRVE